MKLNRKIAMFLVISCILTMTCGCSAGNEQGDENVGKPTEVATPTPVPTATFDETYTEVEGVLTFRGDNLRSKPSYGNTVVKTGVLEEQWRYLTAQGGSWGNGAGWTGQPAVVKWSDEVREMMNIKDKFKNDPEFVEVIQASLNGKIYFLDLKTGEETRKPIDLPNPIKGSVSVDPRGYPLLYVGQGIDTVDKVGFYIFSLINQKVLFFKNGHDKNAPRHWPYFDSSALFDKDTDTMFVGGENGLVYRLQLNTKFNKEKKKISVNPKIKWFSTKPGQTGYPTEDQTIGVENSIAGYKDKIYFVDNSGTVRCLNTNLKLQWKYKNLDDTDASIVIDIEDGVPMIYTGCEVDKQGNPGIARIVKLNGETGEEIWKRDFECGARYGASPSNGGMLGTPVNGKNAIADLLIFPLCRYPSFDVGTLMALDKKTGKTVWETEMATYAWPSPVDFYDQNSGKAYILQNDHDGTSWIFDAENGEVISNKKVDWYLEASPVVYNNYAVFATRGGYISAYKIK